MIDTCTFCEKKNLCKPKSKYYGYCGWRTVKEEKGDKSNEDSRKKC